eukprot:SAG31_NODE_38519_length_295_cov_1.265306_1_plen_59_part_01
MCDQLGYVVEETYYCVNTGSTSRDDIRGDPGTYLDTASCDDRRKSQPRCLYSKRTATAS